MITASIGGKDYEVPTSWKDISYSQYCSILNFEGSDGVQFLSLISGIPWATLIKVDAESIGMLTQLFTFVKDYTFLEKYNYMVPELEGFDVGNEKWHKLEKAKLAIKKHKHYVCAAREIFKIYFEGPDSDIADMKLHIAWGRINTVLGNINSFFESYKRLNDHEEDPDEFQAGVGRFEQFGFFASCVELSRKMHRTYNEVLDMPAREVYHTFLYDFERADYEKILYRIKSKSK